MVTQIGGSKTDPTLASCTAFEGSTRIASGDLESVAVAAKAIVDRGGTLPIHIFDNATSALIDVDFRDSVDDVLLRLRIEADFAARSSRAASPRALPRGPGRPRLGVIAREVTLLPRHWDWLNGQPGRASAAIRRLVDVAMGANVDLDRDRQARESACRFISAMAGNQAGFEEATRALFAGDRAGFEAHTTTWPLDVRDHATMLAFRDRA